MTRGRVAGARTPSSLLASGGLGRGKVECRSGILRDQWDEGAAPTRGSHSRGHWALGTGPREDGDNVGRRTWTGRHTLLAHWAPKGVSAPHSPGRRGLVSAPGHLPGRGEPVLGGHVRVVYAGKVYRSFPSFSR